MSKTDRLHAAYSLATPDEAKALYREWATSYDDSFGSDMGYVAPREVARIFQDVARDNTPILDVGAGTGLIAEHLGCLTVDALDITQEMLDVAQSKGLYRNLINADVLKTLPMEDGHYGGVISSGTFTHGHVGPACLPELLRVTRSGGLFVCGCIPAVYDGMGFGSALAVLNAEGKIGDLSFRDIPIYEGADHAHANDRGLVIVFRKI